MSKKYVMTMLAAATVFMTSSAMAIVTIPKSNQNINLEGHPNISAPLILKNEARRTADKLMEKIGELPVVDALKEDKSGLFLIRLEDGEIIYTDSDATFIIINSRDNKPQIYSVEHGKTRNETTELVKPFNKKKMEIISSYIEYKADNEKHKISYFINPGCSYCQKVIEEIDGYNQLGITVKLVPYSNSDDNLSQAISRLLSLTKEEQKNRIGQLTDYLNETDVGDIDWQVTGLPVATEIGISESKKNAKVASLMGFSSSIGIVLDSGTVINGYLDPEIVEEILHLMAAQEVESKS